MKKKNLYRNIKIFGILLSILINIVVIDLYTRTYKNYNTYVEINYISIATTIADIDIIDYENIDHINVILNQLYPVLTQTKNFIELKPTFSSDSKEKKVMIINKIDYLRNLIPKIIEEGNISTKKDQFDKFVDELILLKTLIRKY